VSKNTKQRSVESLPCTQEDERGRGRVNKEPLDKFQNTLHNKNKIQSNYNKPLKIGLETSAPWLFFLKALTPKGFWQKLQVPPPLDFQPVCIYGDHR
jgi:hypothetical protein